MLNYIWAFMIIIGIIYGSLTGHMAELSNAALDSAREAVTLCITMLGVMALWVGLGWACTPAGLKAMEELGKIQRNNKTCKDPTAASNEMCNFLILNISSLQLIPVNIIVYRSQYGSVTPTSIIMPAILATTCSTLAGILFIKFADRSPS